MSGIFKDEDRIVSIIIPAFNSTKTLRYAIPSIAGQDQAFIREVLIVDSSDDGKMDAFMREQEGLLPMRCINSGVRVMPAKQRNIGARAASGRLFVFLDSDVILEPDYITTIVARYRGGYSAGCGSVDLPAFQERKGIALAQYFLQLNEYLPLGGDRGMEFPTGCNTFCDRELFALVGGYPEVRAAEDVLFGISINARTTFWFIPDAKVAHVFREDWDSFRVNQEMLGKYVARYRKNGSSSIIFRGLFPLLLSPAFLALKVLRITPRILGSGWKRVFRFLQASPLFLLGLVFWTIGFTKELMGDDLQP
jgi:glycosyltransferase involved in cell wall biosynthesis